MAEIESNIGNNKTQDDLMEVDLYEGLKVKLPKAEAEKVIAARNADKETRRKNAERLGALEAEKDAATRAARETAERAEIERLQKAGEYEKARELLEANFRQRIEKLGSGRVRDAVSAALANIQDLVEDPKAREDLAAQLSQSCRFDVDTDTVAVMGADGRAVLGADGRPIQVGDLIRRHIDERPYLRRASKTPGSGSTGNGQKPGTNTMTSDQVAELAMKDPKALAKFFAEGGKQI